MLSYALQMKPRGEVNLENFVGEITIPLRKWKVVHFFIGKLHKSQSHHKHNCINLDAAYRVKISLPVFAKLGYQILARKSVWVHTILSPMTQFKKSSSLFLGFSNYNTTTSELDKWKYGTGLNQIMATQVLVKSYQSPQYIRTIPCQ